MTIELARRLEGPITIRQASSVDDYRACQDAQRLAWGITEPGYLIPIATMVGANLHGGLVLGAFHDDGHAVGMSFAFLGRIDAQLCLYSQLTGIVPEWQSRGLGLELKMVQREFALRSSLSVIAWAFDPLQAGNAHFNLMRLGARVGRYIDNMYGERTDSLNAGVPTDRLIAEWQIDRDQRPRHEDPANTISELPHLIRAEQGSSGSRIPTGVDEPSTSDHAFVEIPPRIGELRRQDPDAAESWRRAVRHALHRCFASGYLAVGFLREEPDRGGRCGYLLRR